MRPLKAVLEEISPEMAVLRLEGDFEGDSAMAVQQQLTDFIDDRPTGTRLLVDFSQISYVDSTAIGVLIGLAKRAIVHQVQFGVFGVTEPVRKVIQVTRVDKILTVYDELR